MLRSVGLGLSGVTPGSYTSANITVDAHGIVTVASNGSGGGTNYWTLNGSGDIYNNNASEAIGIGQQTPLAQLHVTPFPLLGGGNTITLQPAIIGSLTGYGFGSGDKNYTVYGEDSGRALFTPGVSGTFTEPTSSDYDPTNANASINYLETGYIASGYNFIYTYYALYGGSTEIGVGSTMSNDTGGDSGDASPYAVDNTWNAPVGSYGTPDGYLVVLSGSNPNSGFWRVVTGTSFIDDSTGWTDPGITPIPTYNPLLYQVSITTPGAIAPVDNYIYLNTTSATYLNAGNVTAAVDEGIWTSGVPTTTPTGQTKTAVFDGEFIDFNSVPYSFPASNQAGFAHADGSTPNHITFRDVTFSDILATDNELVFGVGSRLAQSSNGFFNGTSMRLSADFALITTNDNSTSGTVNNLTTLGIPGYRFTNNITFTGFANPTPGKLLYIQSGAGAVFTFKNQNAGSSANNRIITPDGNDAIQPVGTISWWQYDGNADKWVCLNIGKPDVTVLANTWTQNQTYNAVNIITDTTTGTKIGTATSQKFGFFNATPVAQQTGNISTALSNLGLVTSGTLPVSSITSGTALTKTDDTNVTMTLGGTPTTALLTATSMTLGWTGQLSAARGGTGASTLTGAGIPITSSADLTSQTAAASSVVAVTAPNDAVMHTYQVGAYLTINSVVTDVIQIQVTYTDENSASQTQTFSTIGATPAISLSTVGAFVFASFNIRAKFNTAITIKTNLTTSIGSINYDVGGTIQRLN